MSLPLKFSVNSKLPYPIGVLDDVEIQFLHYKTEQEATEKWSRRKQRINLNNLFITYSDDGDKNFEEDYFNRYKKLPFEHKLFFSAKPRESTPDCTVITHNWSSEARSRRYEKSFDAVKWLNKENNFIKKKFKQNIA